jgi:hypothetical protein
LETSSGPWQLVCVYATRARVRGASAALWTSARLLLRPRTRPPGKSIPRLIKSSTAWPTSYKSSSHNLSVYITNIASRYRTRTLAPVDLLIHAPGSAHAHLLQFQKSQRRALNKIIILVVRSWICSGSNRYLDAARARAIYLLHV